MTHDAGELARPIQNGAVISPCNRFRYWLHRRWDARNLVAFVMLNPSTADAENDDPTIRKCIGFAQRWGYGGIVVVNLYAFRATSPKQLALASITQDVEGPENHAYAMRAFDEATKVIAAWGTMGGAQAHTMRGWMDAAGIQPWALDVTKGGHPKHPLYVPYAQQPSPYRWGR